jgi:HEAT repeat protein
VTSEDVDTWTGTVKGPGKIVAVVLAEKYGIDLRAHAAGALVDMERQDVNGLAELQRVVQKLDDKTRQQIIERLVPRLEQWMKEEGGEGDDDPTAAAPAQQIRAKDAAYLLTSYADVAMRTRLIQAVVSWYVVDFERRALAGDYSVEQVVKNLGAPAATVLVEALSAKLPQQALTKLAELIGQLGSAAAKKKAAKRMVEIELEMEGDGFRKWIEKGVKEQIAKSDKKYDAAILAKMVELNRNKFINEGALPAMKHLAPQKEVADRLLQIASTAVKIPDRRVRALQALEGNAKKEHLDALLSLALDQNNPASVRDYAFDRVGDIRSPKAIPPMWPLIQDAGKQRTRWRAGELVLAIGGKKVLAEFFGKLPDGDDVAYEPEELEGYASRMSQMNPLPMAEAHAQLKSPNWFGRVIAARFLERRGTQADVRLLKALAKDDTKVEGKGWKEGHTVGKVAKEALASLRERLKQQTPETPTKGAPGAKP